VAVVAVSVARSLGFPIALTWIAGFELDVQGFVGFACAVSDDVARARGATSIMREHVERFFDKVVWPRCFPP
jgi:hypothetical protein